MKIDIKAILSELVLLREENKKLKKEIALLNAIYVKETKDVEYDSNGNKIIKQYFEDKE
jgi:hypothetical protein